MRDSVRKLFSFKTDREYFLILHWISRPDFITKSSTTMIAIANYICR